MKNIALFFIFTISLQSSRVLCAVSFEQKLAKALVLNHEKPFITLDPESCVVKQSELASPDLKALRVSSSELSQFGALPSKLKFLPLFEKGSLVLAGKIFTAMIYQSFLNLYDIYPATAEKLLENLDKKALEKPLTVYCNFRLYSEQESGVGIRSKKGLSIRNFKKYLIKTLLAQGRALVWDNPSEVFLAPYLNDEGEMFDQIPLAQMVSHLNLDKNNKPLQDTIIHELFHYLELDNRHSSVHNEKTGSKFYEEADLRISFRRLKDTVYACSLLSSHDFTPIDAMVYHQMSEGKLDKTDKNGLKFVFEALVWEACRTCSIAKISSDSYFKREEEWKKMESSAYKKMDESCREYSVQTVTKGDFFSEILSN